MVGVGRFQQLGSNLQECVDIKRFAEKHVCALLLGELLVTRVGVGRDDDDRWMAGMSLPEPVEHGETAAAGHDQVEDDQVGCIPFGPNQGLGPVTGHQDLVSAATKCGFDHLENRLVIVDE